MKLRAVLAILSLLLAWLISQPAAASTDSQVWATVSATADLSGPWRLQEELTGRFSDRKNGLYEIESNTLLGYRLNRVVTVWGGYTHDPQYSAGHFTRMEQRTREQVTFDNFTRLGPGKLSARLRLEQRWRSGLDGTGWRLRPYLKYSFPIEGKIALNLSSEPFINFNRTAFQTQRGLDRVRNLITVSAPLSKFVSGEAGYMNQHLFVRGGHDESDNIAYFALSLRR